MDDPRLVHGIHPVDHLREERLRGLLRVGAALLDRAEEVAPGDELHREVHVPRARNNLEHRA